MIGRFVLVRFSHRVPFCMVSRTRAAAVTAPMRQGSRVTRRSAFQVLLSRALARSAGARSALISWLRVRLSAHSWWPLVGTRMPMPAPA